MLSGRIGRGRTKRSHFIFEKASGKLIDKAVGVKPANECVLPSLASLSKEPFR